MGEMDKGDWEEQTSNYGMNKPWEQKGKNREYSPWHRNSVA